MSILLLPCSVSAQANDSGAVALPVIGEESRQKSEDVVPLLTTARELAAKGERDKAFVILQRILITPVAPDARPPGLWPGPFDYRGEARWAMAELRRSQGRWAEALELYRENRKTYPRSDGCVASGAAFQQMMLVEGVCLENLGRVEEAVQLYWPASMYVSGQVPPLVTRRLVDLYLQNNQLSVLEKAVAREKEDLTKNYVTISERPLDAGASEQDKQRWQEHLAYSGIPAFDRVRHFRKAARERRWPLLLEALQYKPDQRNESALNHEGPLWRRREAVSALQLVSTDAIPILERESLKDDQNPYLKAALILCRTPAIDPYSWRQETSINNGQLQNALQEMSGYNTAVWQFAKTAPLKLPAQLPPVLSVGLPAL